MAPVPHKLGKYEIKTVLGQGAMGVVYQAYDPDIDRTVAIKMLHSHLRGTQEGKSFAERFRREAQAAARCLHPNIVAVFELGQEQGQDFIVMEYVQGEELKYFLASSHVFSWKESVHIACEVLSGLEAAHARSVVHRDIKPANIILLDNGGVKLADFGVARMEQSDLTVAGNMVGTPSYMCPEGLRGEAVDLRADIYSTGMVLLEMLVGMRPGPQQLYSQTVGEFLDQAFQSERGSALPPELQQVLRKALAERREDRYQQAADFRRELRNYQTRDDTRQTAAETLAETVVSQRALRPPETRAASPQWGDEELLNLEKDLASHVGPLAGILVRKYRQSGSVHEFVDALAGHIEDMNERSGFCIKARRHLGAGLSTGVGSRHGETGAGTGQGTGASLAGRRSGAASASGSVADTVAPEVLDGLARQLAYHVGPLAPQLVRRSALRCASVPELCRQLAENIPDEKEREAFLRTTLS